jgi:hypothetical protein
MATFTEDVSYQLLVHNGGEIDEIRWTVTLKDGVPFAKTKHTENFRPGDDLKRAQAETKQLAQALWTPERVKAWTTRAEAAAAAARGPA